MPWRVLWLWLLWLLLRPLVSPTWASSHWVVTEEGRIQAQTNSIFHMKRPYDLVSFLEQERRFDVLESLRKEIGEHGRGLDAVEAEARSRHEDIEAADPPFETRFFEADSDCRAAGQPLTEFDLFVSTMLEPVQLGPTVMTILERKPEDLVVAEGAEPKCPRGGRFDVDEIDDLESFKQISSLWMAPEVGIMSTVLGHGRFNLGQFGRVVAHALTVATEDDLWLAALLASGYWRVRGRAADAIACLRWAVGGAPQGHAHLGLLALANVLHRSHRSEDAAEALLAAAEVAPDNAIVQFTLGNVFATMLMFERSEEAFRQALFLEPSFSAALLRMHAVSCHRKMEAALEEQHSDLQRTLAQLRQYKHRHETWAGLLNKIVSEQATEEARSDSSKSYNQLKTQISSSMGDPDCVKYRQLGQTYLACKKDGAVASSTESDYAVDIEELLRDFELKVDARTKNATDEDEDNYGDPKLPSLPPKYSKWTLDSAKDVTAGADWPTEADCVQNMAKPPQWNEYPSVFLSPENKGFDVRRLLSTDVELSLEEKAPGAWDPPFCKRLDGPAVDKYDQLESVKRWTFMSAKQPEKEIEAAFVVHSPVKNFQEWGARITRALKRNLAPKWLVQVLAGTYWRVWGHPQNGLHCYRHALAAVPHAFRDVVLTNFAGLLYKTGAVDDALVMAKDAAAIDPKDPDTNFLLANLYSAKGNMSGAMLHYRRALRMRPDHEEARKLLLAPACHTKFKLKGPASSASCSADKANCDKTSASDGDASIVCENGHCMEITEKDFIKLDQEKESSKQSKKNSKSSKKSKSKKKSKEKDKKKKDAEAEAGAEAALLATLMPKEGEQTVLWQSDPKLKPLLPDGAVEIGTIAETEPEDEEIETEQPNVEEKELEISPNEASSTTPVAGVFGPVLVLDDPLPDVLLRVTEKLATPPPTAADCDEARAGKPVSWQVFTSTWLSVTAKNVDIREYVEGYMEQLDVAARRPFCPDVESSLLSLDHLVGVAQRRDLHLAAESGLKEAFQGLTGEDGVTVEDMATRIAISLEKNSTSWVLSTAAALYWRVKGNSAEAVTCLRHALRHAPHDMKDIPLISLANILHRAGLYNNALVVNNMALEISPKFVVIHFTMANIYASKGDLDMAVSFYLSTLALQSTFEPAKDRLVAIQCGLGPHK